MKYKKTLTILTALSTLGFITIAATWQIKTIPNKEVRIIISVMLYLCVIALSWISFKTINKNETLYRLKSGSFK